MQADSKSRASDTARSSSLSILVVEDDMVLGKSLKRGLDESGYSCQWTRSGKNVMEMVSEQLFDAVVLDLMLPEVDGLTILKQLRQEGMRIPVIVLTALGSVDERVTGLNAGADDYLVKPFAFPELLARLQAITRRDWNRPSAKLSAGPLTLDLTTRRVNRGDKEIDLTPTEFSLLEFLMRYQGQVVTRGMLCEHLWAADWEGVTNVIDVHINRLRGKIDRGFDSSLIHTIRGRGYALRATLDGD